MTNQRDTHGQTYTTRPLSPAHTRRQCGSDVSRPAVPAGLVEAPATAGATQFELFVLSEANSRLGTFGLCADDSTPKPAYENLPITDQAEDQTGQSLPRSGARSSA